MFKGVNVVCLFPFLNVNHPVAVGTTKKKKKKKYLVAFITISYLMLSKTSLLMVDQIVSLCDVTLCSLSYTSTRDER